jgi:hypothetical protein
MESITRELVKELGISDESVLSGIEYAQKCVDLYNEALRAMGEVPSEPTTRTIKASEIKYMPTRETEFKYEQVSGHNWISP